MPTESITPPDVEELPDFAEIADEQEWLTKMKETYEVIQVRCATLDDNHRPRPTLHISNTQKKCDVYEKGDCFKCNKFAGMYVPDGVIFSYMVFTGFCGKNYESTN